MVMTDRLTAPRAPGSKAPGARRGDGGPAGRASYLSLRAAAHDALADAASAEGWPAAERATALAELDRVTDLLTAVRGRLLRAERDAGTWAGRGDRDLAGWRGRTARTGVGEAAQQVREAEVLEALPEVERALTGGDVHTGHVGVLAKAAARVPERVVDVMRSASGQAELLGLATRRDTRGYARAVEQWIARHDPATVQRTHDDQRARRFLHVTDSPGGTHIKGLLDSVSGRTLRLALEAASPRPAADDLRTPEQRRADALHTLADRLLTDPRTTPGAQVRPHVSVVLREETWTTLRRSSTEAELPAGSGPDGARGPGGPGGPGGSSLPPKATGRAGTTGAAGSTGTVGTVGTTGTAGAAGAAGPAGNDGNATDAINALNGVPAPSDDDGNPLPASEVARILCDCELTRIVVDREGTPVDLGRTARLFSPAQRRAIAHRDGGCAWAGCAIPARWCDVHHIAWWMDDRGDTSVDNGVQLCSYHHHEVHRRSITILRHLGQGRGSPGAKNAAGTARARGSATERGSASYTFTLPNGRVLADNRAPTDGRLEGDERLPGDERASADGQMPAGGRSGQGMLLTGPGP